MRRQLSALIVALIDVGAIALGLLVFALFDHALPSGGVSAADTRTTPAPVAVVSAPAGGEAAPVVTAEPLGAKFADKFTGGEVISEATRYVGKNVCATLITYSEEGLTYYVIDVYLRDIACLRSAFADDRYGKSITEWISDIASRNGAIGAINGDYYGIGAFGLVIRNGVLYRDVIDLVEPACVLYSDGTMGVVYEGEATAEEIMARGAWQAWQFGPSLLNEDGSAKTDFSYCSIATGNPRTVLGYYEPGHYALIAVDGRQGDYSGGLTMSKLAALCESMGLKLAYNLDGGQTTQMVFAGQVANRPYKDGRKVSDIIYIADM